MGTHKINVRVYAICIKNNEILVLFEKYAGEDLVKLPGGGLEYGEGTMECLHRELKEELNLRVKNVEHFYTQEAFLKSKFNENEQLLTIYYLAEIEYETELKILEPSIEKVEWKSLKLSENPFVLPVDRLVFEKLKEKFESIKN